MASDERKRDRIGRRQVLTLSAGLAVGAGVATAMAARDAEAATPTTESPDPRATEFRDTDHIRRYYERARY
jgi:hypothetical protein